MWEEVKDFIVLLVIFSILVEWSYYGMVGRIFEVAVFPIVPM